MTTALFMSSLFGVFVCVCILIKNAENDKYHLFLIAIIGLGASLTGVVGFGSTLSGEAATYKKFVWERGSEAATAKIDIKKNPYNTDSERLYWFEGHLNINGDKYGQDSHPPDNPEKQ